jgi:DNA polymerase V
MNVLALKTALELRGISCIELGEERPAKKSITVSRSFSHTTGDINHLRQAVVTFITRGAEKLRKEKKEAKYVGVFVRTNPYSQVDAQYSGYTFTCLPYPTDNTMELIRGGVGCLEKIYREGFLYKKAGILLGDFFDKSLARFDMFDERDLIKSTVLMQTLDKINSIYGSKTIYFGGGGKQQKWLPKASMKSKSYTTKWGDIITAY